MMTRSKENIWLLIATLVAVCLTIYTLSDIVLHPSVSLTSLSGDGAKNNFTYLYHSIYDKGFHFEGMNYPYGENVVFADGMSTWSVPLTYMKHITIGDALSLFWLTVGLSYVLSIVFLYLILRHYKVEALAAVIFGCLIGISSPQLFRILGHFGLGYMNVIPMLFYYTLKYNERPQWKYGIYIFLLGLVMTFVHPYFSALILVWTAFYVAGYFLFTSEKLMIKARAVLPLLVSIVCLFAVIAIIMKVTDPLTDRPKTPYGMLVYTAKKYDIYSSDHSPIWRYLIAHDMLKNVVPHTGNSGQSEGYSYIGIVAVLAILYALASGIVNTYKKRKERLVLGEQRFSPIWLFMAVAALLLSMGVPYVWHMEWLLDYMSFMRQFRSLGRFSWIFYYIMTVYSVVVIYDYYTRSATRGKAVYGYTVLVLAALVWTVEASGYTKVMRTAISSARDNYNELFSKTSQGWAAYLQEHHHDHSDFQAILMVPFFHIGSDKIWVGDGDGRLLYSTQAALQLHLPIIDVMMTRSSWSQARQQVKLVAGPYADKPILRDIKSNKPFLLLHFEEDSITTDEKYLMQSADYIGYFNHCKLYACYPERLATSVKRYAATIDSILPGMRAPDTCIGAGSWYVDHMDWGHAGEHFYGTGAAPRVLHDDSDIATIPVMPLRDSQEYEFSTWFLLGDKNYLSPSIFLDLQDSSGKLIVTYKMDSKYSVDSYNMWFRAALYFYLDGKCRSIKCRIMNWPNPAYITMDEMQLRPAEAIIISKSADGAVLVNNHLFRKGK